MKIRVHYIKPVAVPSEKPSYLSFFEDFNDIEKVDVTYGHTQLYRNSSVVVSFNNNHVIYWEKSI